MKCERQRTTRRRERSKPLIPTGGTMYIYSKQPVPFRASRGKHRNAAEGTCLMELASVFGDEPFTDHPRCVHPALAELARLLNDHLDDEVRQSLVAHVPDMMRVPVGDPCTGPRLVVSCLDTALTAPLDRIEARRVRRYRQRAERRLQRMESRVKVGTLRRLDSRLAVSRGIRVAVGLGAGRLDETAMAAMLIDATRSCQSTDVTAQPQPAQSDRALASTAV
jgi:hypothetical protein